MKGLLLILLLAGSAHAATITLTSSPCDQASYVSGTLVMP